MFDHYRNPRNRGELPVPAARRVEGYNRLCGDEVVVYVETDGKMRSDGADAHDTGWASTANLAEDALRDIEDLQGVVQFRSRISCAVLPWTTPQHALDGAAAGTG